MPLLLHLIRHGQASVLEADYDQLQPLGEQQARLLGQFLCAREQRFSALYVGPLRRQLETMRLLRESAAPLSAEWPEPIVLDELAEGPFEALMKRYVRPRLPSDPSLQAIAERLRAASDVKLREAALEELFRFMIELWERGEVSGDDLEPAQVFQARVLRTIERIADREREAGEVAVVTSSGVITRLLQHGGWQTPLEGRFRVHNTSVSVLEVAVGGAVVARSCGLTEHLSEPGLRTLL